MWYPKSRIGRARLFALSIACWYATNVCSAADLTLRDVISMTAQRSPQLAALEFESESLRQRWKARSYSPAPEIELRFENLGGTGELSGVRSLETTLQLSKIIELGNKVRLRSELGEAEMDESQARHLNTRANVIAEAARRFLHVLADQAQLDVTHRATQLYVQARSAVAERIRSGAISKVFLNRAEIELARARIREEHAEHELATSRLDLAIMWGDNDAQYERAVGDLFSFPTIEPLEAYVAKLDANPDLVGLASSQHVIETRKRVANSLRTPDVTFSAGVRRLEGFDDQALVAGISVPLGTSKRAAPGLKAAQAEGEALRLQAAARRLELRSLLFGFYQEILHARSAADALHKDILPQAQQMVETTAQGYRLGRYSFVELIDAQQALIQLEQDSIRAALEFHTNLIEIERITGADAHSSASR